MIQPSYGVRSEGCQLSAADVELINLSIFDESNLDEHMMKVLFGCGLYAAFRGSAEHTYFSKSQVRFGKYPDNFEDHALAGHRYVAIDNMPRDKTSKITVTNAYARPMNNMLRFPINPNSPRCFGAALERLILKMSPGQSRVYGKQATDMYLEGLRQQGNFDAQMYPTVVLGEKKINALFKAGARKLGLPANFQPHSLRSACITFLANNPSVSLAETMRVARHTSVSASKVYQRVDGVSEGNRLRALGVELPAAKQKTTVGTVPEVAMSQKRSAAVMDVDEPVDVKVGSAGGCVAARSGYQSDSSGDDSIVEVLRNYRRMSKEDVVPSMTQVGLEDLRGDINDLTDRMDIERKPRAKSKNVLEIEKLRGVVRRLQRKIEDQELYAGSLENDRLQDVTSARNLREDLRKEKRLRKKLQRENGEFTRFVLRDHERGDL